MDKSIATAAPYFDAGEVGRELMGLLDAQKGEAHEARPAVLDKLKQLLRTARFEAERQLAADGNGRRCAEGLSAFQDELIRLVYDYTVANVYRATNPSDAERMAIIATGGYGRGLLAPFSDIDLLFLLPYKQTPWGESVVEYMLYLLWDLGLKVGHATRTVEQSIKLSRADITIRTAMLDSRLILGDQALFDELTRRFRREVVSGTARQFVEAKLAERDERHRAPASRAIASSPTSRTARAACATCTRCTGSPSISTATASTGDRGSAAVFTPRSTPPSAAARTSCGRCAATCTSWRAGRRSG